MADILPNVTVGANEVKDLYSETGIAVGTQISVKMIGGGEAKLYSGASLSAEPTDSDGFYPLYPREDIPNSSGDAGAFIWSLHGCVVNVRAV